MKKYYLDSCVWISYFDENDEKHEETVRLFERIIKEKALVIVTDRHWAELKNKGLLEEYEDLKNALYLKGMCKGVRITEEDRQVALKQNEWLGVGFNDCLHVLIAKKLKAIPISYDKHWFEIGRVYGIRVYKPEEVL